MQTYIENYKQLLSTALELERESQLATAYEERRLYRFRFDNGALDMAFSVALDFIERDLSTAVMKEQITEEEKDEIFEDIQ
jgi:hypothetical protein